MSNKSIFVPGRLCLFGEHSDWAGGYRRIDESITPGYCLAIGTDQGINAIISRSDGFVLRSANVNGEIVAVQNIRMDEYELFKIAKFGNFFSYAAGVAYRGFCTSPQKVYSGDVFTERS